MRHGPTAAADQARNAASAHQQRASAPHEPGCCAACLDGDPRCRCEPVPLGLLCGRGLPLVVLGCCRNCRRGRLRRRLRAAGQRAQYAAAPRPSSRNRVAAATAAACACCLRAGGGPANAGLVTPWTQRLLRVQAAFNVSICCCSRTTLLPQRRHPVTERVILRHGRHRRLRD